MATVNSGTHGSHGSPQAGNSEVVRARSALARGAALDEALTAWGGGIPISAEDFAGLRLEAPLARAFALRPGPPPFPADGAARVAGLLLEAVGYLPIDREPLA